jgi:hypothetical protein
MPPDCYYAYIDESGDRGWGGRSSDCFVLAAAILHASDTSTGRSLLAKLRSDLGKPAATVLHWTGNVRTHSQRKYASTQIGEFDRLTIATVAVHKPSFYGQGTGLSDHVRLYNYAVRYLLERLSWFAKDSGRPLAPVFSHVKGFPYDALTLYLKLLEHMPTQIKWDALGKHQLQQPSRIEPLQMADLIAGVSTRRSVLIPSATSRLSISRIWLHACIEEEPGRSRHTA